MKIAFIGQGKVGGSLAKAASEAGLDVTLIELQKNSDRVKEIVNNHDRITSAIPDIAIPNSDIILLTTPYSVTKDIVSELKELLVDKTVVDCTNPVGPEFTHALKSVESVTSSLQKDFTKINFVKSFNIYGFENFVYKPFSNLSIKPVMFFCGENKEAKKRVAELISLLGWNPLDVGGIQQAVHLEHLALMWIDYVRRGGNSPKITWGVVSE